MGEEQGWRGTMLGSWLVTDDSSCLNIAINSVVISQVMLAIIRDYHVSVLGTSYLEDATLEVVVIDILVQSS